MLYGKDRESNSEFERVPAATAQRNAASTNVAGRQFHRQGRLESEPRQHVEQRCVVDMRGAQREDAISDGQHRRSGDGPAAQRFHSFIGLGEAKGRCAGPYGDAGRKGQELLPVPAGEIGDGADHPLTP